MSLPARVVVVTGGSSGIGRCTAARFAQQGCSLGLIARGIVGLQATQQDLVPHSAACAVVAADVTDEAALQAAAEAIERQLGPIDVWVNCAGIGTYSRFIDTPSEQFRRVTEVTYLGTVNGTRQALRRMLPRDGGCIVNVCSATAFHGVPLLASYAGAKAALRGFDQAVRAELALDGSRVRLRTIFPPAINTPFFDHAVSHMGRPGRPLPPVYPPEAVAEAIVLAAAGGSGEMKLSFTTLLFAAACRVAPGLVRRALHQSGFEGSLSRLPEAMARYEPTLLAPSESPSPVHGAHGKRARPGSWHLKLLQAAARLK